MHGVLRHYTLDAANIPEVVRRVANGGVPILGGISGCVSHAIIDAGRGRLVTEREAGAEESTRAAETVHTELKSLMPNAPEVISGEVRLRVIGTDRPAGR